MKNEPVEVALSRAMALHRADRLRDAKDAYRQIAKAHPRVFEARYLLGVVCHQLGDAAEALHQFDSALEINPKSAPAHTNRGVVLQHLKRLDESLASYDRALALAPDDADTFYNRGNALKELARFVEAVASYDRAIALSPDHADALYNRGNALGELRRLDEALASYDRVIALAPRHVSAWSNRGIVLAQLERFDDALATFDKAIAMDPRCAAAFSGRGRTLQGLKRFGEAVAIYDKAIENGLGIAEVFSDRGNALRKLARFDEALQSCEEAIALKGDHAEAWINRAAALIELERIDEALASCDRAIALQPDDPGAFYNRGLALAKLWSFEAAVASYDQAIALRPDYADAFNNRGVALQKLARLDAALASYSQALALSPAHERAFSGVVDCELKLCDWARREARVAELREHVSARKSIVNPFTLIGYSDDEALLSACAQNFVRNSVVGSPQPLWTGATWRNERIKVAYLSADFHRHATAYLTAGLFERHDRSRFEIIGVSFGPDDGSAMRARLVAGFDAFLDVRTKSDQEVAQLLHDLHVDIAVDLKGHTDDQRLGILAYRPAPIQVTYLGFPGSTGADFIDYIIADAIVLPFEQQPHYTERIVHLPDCYQANDRQRAIAASTPARQELGLPAESLVFCCFNTPWKITPAIFDVWMRLLRAVPGSVLWLLGSGDATTRNLRQEASARGIDPARARFAGQLPLEDHLARYRVADLFLDTLPCNAHTTASDALWAGLPVVTCARGNFAGRVAASLLRAAGLPELVTESLEEYEHLALHLATDDALRRGYRERLEQGRLNVPLFDTDRFSRRIEAAYSTMWELWQRGERPRSFAVDPD
jgi:protein O-GlcNAc transferase